MFSIGEFSKLGRVTVDALRHYDALGLLKPAKVDPFTGYRYYSASQLLSLHRILALKEIGFSLDEIARIFQQELTSDQIRGMLKAQLVRAESEIESAQSRRGRVLARLNYLDLENSMPVYEVTLKPVEKHTVAAIRENVPTIEQMPERCSEMFDALAGWMNENGLPIGPSLTIYHNEAYTREDIDTECAFIIPNSAAAKRARPDKRIEIRQMEALPLTASTVVTDDFYKKVDGLTPAYNAIAQWIEENGYKIVGRARELFYGSAEKGDLTAEVQFPVEKA
jgi:DNA-binding transcriptional MerR regulator